MPEVNTVPYTALEEDLASRIRQPLAFLSRRRLAFLDVDRWVCTWRLPSIHSSLPAVGIGYSGRGRNSIERHYFLPGDWAVGNDPRLCTISPDGTFFCPRNDEVATVQSLKLKK